VRARTHARGSWRSRAAAWPCHARGTGIPGPRHDAAVVGDGGSGVRRRRVGFLHKETARRPEGREVLRVTTEGSSAAHGSRRQQRGREGSGGGDPHRGAEGRRAWCGGGSKPVGRGRAGRAAALVSSIGRRRGEAPAVSSVASSSLGSGWRRWPPPRALLLLLLLSSHFSSCGGGRKV
jgi:hypothetical protein